MSVSLHLKHFCYSPLETVFITPYKPHYEKHLISLYSELLSAATAHATQCAILEPQVAIKHDPSPLWTGTADWFQIGKGVRQGCLLSLCLFNLFAEYIM